MKNEVPSIKRTHQVHLCLNSIRFQNFFHVEFDFSSLIEWTALEGPPILTVQVRRFLCLNGSLSVKTSQDDLCSFCNSIFLLPFCLLPSIAQPYAAAKTVSTISEHLIISFQVYYFALVFIEFYLIDFGPFLQFSKIILSLLSCKVLVTVSSMVSPTSFISVFSIPLS